MAYSQKKFVRSYCEHGEFSDECYYCVPDDDLIGVEYEYEPFYEEMFYEDYEDAILALSDLDKEYEF